MKHIKKHHIFIATLFLSAAIMGAGTNYDMRVWLCEKSNREICYKLHPPPVQYGVIECTSLRKRTGVNCYRF